MLVFCVILYIGTRTKNCLKRYLPVTFLVILWLKSLDQDLHTMGNRTRQALPVLIWWPDVVFRMLESQCLNLAWPNQPRRHAVLLRFELRSYRPAISVSNPDLEPGGQKWPTQVEKNHEISCFEVLNVLFWGQKASSVAWKSFMEAEG